MLLKMIRMPGRRKKLQSWQKMSSLEPTFCGRFRTICERRFTSISGNASNLVSNSESFTEEMKQAIYKDIYEDSMWLIDLVENLLAISKIDEGRLNIQKSSELMDEVISEALRYLERRKRGHIIEVHSTEEFLLAKIDARLIVQVIITHLVDNAIKYTPEGSVIRILTKKQGKEVIVQ